MIILPNMPYSPWAFLSERRPERAYQSPEERQRLERAAIGRICGCRRCTCCHEYLKATTKEMT